MAIDLEQIIRSNSQFFDDLVDLIPPKLYLPFHENVEQQWTGRKNKAQRWEAKRTARKNLKKAKRDRLDPENFFTASQILQQRNEAAEKEKEDEEEEEQVPIVPTERVKSSQELRARLHKKIEAIRAQRLVNKARDWQNKTKDASKKRKKSETNTVSNKRQKQMDNEAETKDAVQPAKEKVPVARDMEFGRVKIDSQRRLAKRKSKEKLLQEATKLQKDLQDSEKGKEISSKHSWDAALGRASGEKVFDNPKLLKQSLKRDQQRREKSAKKWQERQDSEAQRAQEKQQTRAAHVKERIDTRKQRLIAKREKKLMRPGFEGRKAGFLNDKKTSK